MKMRDNDGKNLLIKGKEDTLIEHHKISWRIGNICHGTKKSPMMLLES